MGRADLGEGVRTLSSTGVSVESQRPEYELGDEEFRFLASFLSRQTGIVLSDHKRQMVCGRLVRRLRALHLNSFTEYCDLLKGPEAEAELEHVVNAITTNITQFFREPHHFIHLHDHVLQPIAAEKPRRRRVRLWSAGCSSGEEPHTIAMVAADVFKPGDGRDVLILATDIDTNMLAKGAAGLYDAEAAQSIPETYRKRYVRRVAHAPDKIQIAEEAHDLIRFKQLNLMGAWPMKGPFDAIFCRNVAIYFDKPTQRALFNRYADLLAMGGYFYLGHAESLIGVSDRFEVADKTVYRRIR